MKLKRFPRCRQVYINKSLDSYKAGGIKHAFTALSDKFGHEKPNQDVFELFGEFEKGQKDVLFDVSRLEMLTNKKKFNKINSSISSIM